MKAPAVIVKRETSGRIPVNTIFSDTISCGSLAYDYSGVWARRSGGNDWKAVVRNADVVCSPSGTREDDAFSESEVIEILRRLINDSIALAVASRYRAGVLKM